MDKTKDDAPTNGHLTATEARAIVEAADQARIERCRAEFQKVLDSHNCQLDVMVLLKAGQVIPQVQIVSR